ncbi:hypothetical protein C8F01DRAFT_1144682 [Mycena amicta]|nr:hypothetical protein C8F01DRAFT_1144682 [Mycena amicta]
MSATQQPPPSATAELLDEFPWLRILVAGQSGAGKSSLIAHVFGINKQSVSHSTRGEVDIDEEILSPQNRLVLVHDSQGFEPGVPQNFTKAANFLRDRAKRVDLEDHVHIIWLCIQMPRARARVFEDGDHEFFKLAQELNIPVLVVFTMYDKLVNSFKLLNEPEADSLAEKTYESLCVDVLEQANGIVQCTKTSGLSGGIGATPDQDALDELVQMSRNLVRENRYSIVQRVNAQEKIEACIAVGMEGYWSALGSTANPGFTLKVQLEAAHDRMVDVWNINDPLGLLQNADFKQVMVQFATPSNVSEAKQWFAPSIRTFMAYIVGLTIILHKVFLHLLHWPPRTESLTADDISWILERQELTLQYVSDDVRKYVETMSWTAMASSGEVLKEVVNLIKKYTDDDVQASEYIDTALNSSHISLSLADLRAWDTYLPGGGTLVSVYAATHAAEWLSKLSVDFPRRLRSQGFHGPFAYQLSPATEALIVFGVPNAREKAVPTIIHELADMSGFPVVIRSPGQNPLLEQMERIRGGAEAHLPWTILQTVARTVKGGVRAAAQYLATSLQDEPSMPTMPPVPDPTQWVSKDHTAHIAMDLRHATRERRSVDLNMRFKFQRVDNDHRPHDCFASTEVTIMLDNTFYRLDPSWSNVGFVVHRPDSISHWPIWIDPDNEKPQAKSSNAEEVNQSTTGGGSIGIKVPHSVTIGGKLDHTRGTKTTQTHAKEKPDPKCTVTAQPGQYFSQHEEDPQTLNFPDKDFKSWDLNWVPGPDAEHGVKFRFGLGLDLKRSETHSGTPNDISYILRHRATIWKNDTESGKAKDLQGVLLITSTYIPNVFTETQLKIDESLGLDFDGTSDAITRRVSASEGQPEEVQNYIGLARRVPVPAITLLKERSLLKPIRLVRSKRAPAAAVPPVRLPYFDIVLPKEEPAYALGASMWPSMEEQLKKIDNNTLGWERKEADVRNISTKPDRQPAVAHAGSSTDTSNPTESSSVGGATATTNITTASERTAEKAAA